MHTVFYVSDGTAITAEVFGHAVLSQFPLPFEQVTMPFVGDADKAQAVKARIDESFRKSGKRPLVFHTIVDTQLRNIITSSEAKCYDFLNTFVAPIEQQLGIKADPRVHRTHGMDNKKHYDTRIDAVNYALENDDGVTTKAYDEADIILVGVSRCGKTPTSLYLALQFGIRVANYPFIDQDMEQMTLPKALKANRHKLFGLTIDPQRLQEIRQRRMADSGYSAAAQCRYELNQVERLFRMEAIPFIDTTYHSVEEISVKILERTGIPRRIY
ncbi:phosphoenolpyruvate synthase regulatory protein [Oceanisphaera profunda]|uniref:Putative phosphoenolpyruvate synthase regulatory protein n=1 Tax=Oceanisphaera profunda TaxID=1416627 RepID=A0A1Y0D1S0_9GAMM|nr:pyruvate, water dikinase regulatory protein [Oceanisphaera profunda]ART81453.1 phosphoenolpyruvate synthase regulatory protein [Oceanisphaera profunda]